MKNKTNYPVNWNDTIRPAILKRDNYKCVTCGVKHRSTGYYLGETFNTCSDDFELDFAKRMNYKVTKIHLQIAHMDQNPSNNDYSNLQAMCPKHHLSYDNQFNKIKRLMKK